MFEEQLLKKSNTLILCPEVQLQTDVQVDVNNFYFIYFF